jgi:hypothetical protein
MSATSRSVLQVGYVGIGPTHLEAWRRLRAALREVEDASDEGGHDARRYAARVAVELYAVLRLHFAQEEESFHVLAALEETRTRSGGAT